MHFLNSSRLLLVYGIAIVCTAILVVPPPPTFGEQRVVSFEDCVRVQSNVLQLQNTWRNGSGSSASTQALATARTRAFFLADSVLRERWGIRWSPAVLVQELERIAARTTWPDRLFQMYRASGDPTLFQECVLRESWTRQEFARQFAADREINDDARLEARGLVEMLRSGRLNRRAADPRRSLDASESIRVHGKSGLPGWQRGVAEPAELTRSIVVVAQLDETKPEPLAIYRIPKQSAADWLNHFSESMPKRLSDVAPPLPQLAERIERIAARGTGAPDDIWDNGSLDFLREKREHSAVWTGAEFLIYGGRRPFDRGDATGYRFDPVLGTWSQMSTENAPNGRFGHVSVWSGNEMLVWGGFGAGGFEQGGGKYSPATDSWKPMTELDAPEIRSFTEAVWTGTEMLVWGGGRGSNFLLDSGARYSPSTDTWQPIQPLFSPTARRWHSVTWTGEYMVVWGGEDDQGVSLRDGSRYSPTLDRWFPMSAPPAGFGARSEHAATWTGSDVVLWGGRGVSGFSDNNGARYDPATNQWSTLSTSGAPLGDQIGVSSFWSGSVVIVAPRRDNGEGGTYDPVTDAWIATIPPIPSVLGKTIWTGTEILSWGYARGYRIVPGAGSWTPLPHPDILLPRRDHSAVWTGAEMIVWGGANEMPPLELSLGDGASYDPVLDSWSAIASAGAPSGRQKHSAAWTGTEMLIWGTQDIDGGRYNPATDTWSVLPAATDSCTSEVAVWTGEELLVWNGESNDRGCRFDPVAGTWQPITTIGSPSAELDFSSVWTGERWVLWGGREGTTDLDTGATYDPSLNQWTPLPTSGAPTARRKHSAVWTGDSMLIWGGTSADPAVVGSWGPVASSWSTALPSNSPDSGVLDSAVCWTGAEMLVFGGPGSGSFAPSSISGRYDPAQESWSSMTTVREPNERSGHTGVWTGREFLIWGGSGNGFGLTVSSGGAYRVNADSDGDGVAGAFDCLPLDASAFAIPMEVSDLNFSDSSQLAWNESVSTSGSGTTYDVVRADLLSLPSPAQSWECLGSSVTLPELVDSATPLPRQGFAYLVGAKNACGAGGLGADTVGAPRPTPICD